MNVLISFIKKLSSITNSPSVPAENAKTNQSASRKPKYDNTAANLRELKSYKDAEIDEYIFVATLDVKTCDKCGSLDGKVFKVSAAKLGKNLPPLHDGCRCGTRAYFGPKTLKGTQRRARNPATKKSELVPASMTFKQWKKKRGL